MAKEGDTVEPGNKIALISKSGEAAALSEKILEKSATQPPSPSEKIEGESKKLELETTPVIEKPEQAGSPQTAKSSAPVPQLPLKEKERRVSGFMLSNIHLYSSFFIGIVLII